MSLKPNKGCYNSEADALDSVVERIVAHVDPEAIWLFGSRARKEHSPDSDFDLLVVTRLEDGDAGFDYDRVYDPVLGTGVGCDVVPCRIDDFTEQSKSKTGLVRDVLDAGIALYDRSSTRISR
jgi:predicted nucleotidyltransferase